MVDIQTYLFDFGGVLIDLDRRRCVESFRALGMPAMENLLHDFRQQDFLLEHEKGRVSDEAFRNHVRACIGCYVDDARIDAAWNSFLVDVPGYKLDFLLSLRKEHPVYLLSNTNGIHWHWACRHVFSRGGHSVEDYFDRVFLSYEMKMAKPDAGIFRRVIEETALVPQKTLFIDDSEANCTTARSLGFVIYTPQPHEDWRSLFK